MRIAVLHDHLDFIGGGERVALALAGGLDADLYVTDLDPTLPARAGMPDVRAFEIAKVPRRPPSRQDRQMRAFEGASIPDYDLYVASGNWAVFAAPRHRPNLWYCHTPVRVFYDLRERFLDALPWTSRWAARRWIESRRQRYEVAVAGVDRIVANSQNVAGRVSRYLSRESTVVHPPVDVERYRFERIGDFWLSVNLLSHEKRIDLQVEVFRRLPRERLLIAGGTQPGARLDRVIRALHAPPNVQFLGEIDDERLRELYATCRGLVATALDEDFGLAPVEAMASEKAVVAVDEGGYRETVVHGTTGWLVPPDAASLARAIGDADPTRLDSMRGACRSRARAFDRSVFVAGIRALIETMRGSA